MFAGRSEAAGPVDIDRSNSELVPSGGSDVGQLDALLCSLRGQMGVGWGWGGIKPQGSGFTQGHSPNVSVAATSVICMFLFAKRSKML